MKDSRFDLEEVKDGVSLDDILVTIEKAYIEKALDITKGNKNQAADLLGISYRSFRHRIGKYEVENNK